MGTQEGSGRLAGQVLGGLESTPALEPALELPEVGRLEGGGRAGPCPLVGVGCYGNIPFSTQWEAPLSLLRGCSRQPHRWLSASGTWQPSLWQPGAQQQGPVRKGGVQDWGRAACEKGQESLRRLPPALTRREQVGK